jgi:large subunit ribosomal protein L32
MAPLPKKKHTRSRSGKRRVGIKALVPNLSPCPKCKKPIKPHMECPHCGYYYKN